MSYYVEFRKQIWPVGNGIPLGAGDLPNVYRRVHLSVEPREHLRVQFAPDQQIEVISAVTCLPYLARPAENVGAPPAIVAFCNSVGNQWTLDQHLAAGWKLLDHEGPPADEPEPPTGQPQLFE